MSGYLRTLGTIMIVCGVMGGIFILVNKYITLAVVCVFSGVVSGILFFSISEIIELLTEISSNTRKPKPQKSIKPVEMGTES